MTLEQIKNILPTLDNVEFQLENGTFVPEHFHVTEIGMLSKNFIDCGGTIRKEEKVNRRAFKKKSRLWIYGT